MSRRTRQQNRLVCLLVILIVCTATWYRPRWDLIEQRWAEAAAFATRSPDHAAGTTLISMIETRVLSIPDDDSQEIDFFTLCTLSNFLYAKALGAQFRYTVMVDKPDVQDTSLDPQGLRKQNLNVDFCVHPTQGLMPANFCRIPLLWHLLRTETEVENIIHIDSDAVFRSPDLSFEPYLDQLELSRPLGLFNNQPYCQLPCTGFMIMKRGQETLQTVTGASQAVLDSSTSWIAPNSVLTSFSKDWWDRPWIKRNCLHLRDQCTLWSMMGNITVAQSNKVNNASAIQEMANDLHITFFANETQFNVERDDQLIYHQHHRMKDRATNLRRAWVWDDYPLSDREGLRRLLKLVDIRQLNLSAVAADWAQVV